MKWCVWTGDGRRRPAASSVFPTLTTRRRSPDRTARRTVAAAAPPTSTREVERAAAEFEWLTGGEVVLDNAGSLQLPGVSTRPSVYRFRLEHVSGEVAGVYVDETDNLARGVGNRLRSAAEAAGDFYRTSTGRVETR